jgi:toxin ParE1/3/4
MKLLWTKEALIRLQEIENYISSDNPVAAIEFVDKLITIAESLIEYPQKGRVVPELSVEKIRELLYKNYRIVYLIKKNSIDILTIYEGHQLLKKEEIIGKGRQVNEKKIKYTNKKIGKVEIVEDFLPKPKELFKRHY